MPVTEKDRPSDWNEVDWKSYQMIVAGLHSSGENIEVAEEYPYPRNTVESSDIDVVVWDRSDRYTYTTLIECKFHARPVGNQIVNNLVTILNDSDADKGVVVSKSGFQSGAIDMARGTGVELWTLRPIRPDVDFDGRIRKVKLNQTVTYPEFTINEIDLRAVDEENVGKEFAFSFEDHNSRLYTTDRVPTHETFLDRVNSLQRSLNEGQHVEKFEDKMLLIEGDFYHLNSIEYELTLSRETTQMTIDALDDFDLIFINELSGDRDFLSLSDALDAFVEEVADA